jgi:isoleucyl-tRNA synthetase
MANRYKEFKQLNLPSIEKEILERWKRESAFEKSVELRQGAEPFVFMKVRPAPMACPASTMLFPVR